MSLRGIRTQIVRVKDEHADHHHHQIVNLFNVPNLPTQVNISMEVTAK